MDNYVNMFDWLKFYSIFFLENVLVSVILLGSLD